ncbi:TonB family protein [Pseudoalteromonas sp. S16_S37]|uniref:TonB family protein n=1 Tax=Pseudoalteromonas sp. S16_S37 TaxID=2720228 RepID=UPI001680CABC|nr:TonB family protein [Pseudoalteromonas sp. S16_S37]MBD1581099.1 TonB family protein [Pseudoalteromonas sp. S16_S37]
MRNNLITRLTIYYLLGCSWLVKADLYSATLAYQEADYPLAFTEFNHLAKIGNADAMYNLAVMYLHGQGTQKSIEKAFVWFSLANDFGILEASQTAHLVLQQSTEPEKLRKTLQQQRTQLQSAYRLNATLNDLTQLSNEPTIYKVHDELPKYPQEAVRQGIEGWVWLEFDIDDSGKAINIEVVDSYPKHIFTASLLNAVERWRYSDAKQNHTLVYHFTTYKGEQYKQTLPIQKKAYETELRQSINAAEQGMAQVQYKIANWLSMKDYNAYQLLRYHWRSDNPTDELLLAAAKNGLNIAQYRIATQLLTSNNHALAALWLAHAAKTMDIAKYRLATLLLKNGNDADTGQAIKLLEEASEQDHLRSIIKLTDRYVTQNIYRDKTKLWLDKGLKIDAHHPQLLLLCAKLAASPSDAKKLATQALNSANKRHWSSQKITEFLASLATLN